jgi:hypothetical protein
MSQSQFQKELSGLPPEIALELEDHLLESHTAALRSGLSDKDARVAALRSLGSPSDVARQCLEASRLDSSARARLPLPQRVAALGWLGLAIGFASRVCMAKEPTFASVGACVGLSLAALTIALRIRRHRLSARLGVAVSMGLVAAASLGFVLGAGHPWIQDALALTPPALAFLAVFGALSGGAMTFPKNARTRPA